MIWPDPVLMGRSEERLEALAREHGIERWSTDSRSCLSDPADLVYFDQTTKGAKKRVYERRRVEVGPTLPSAGGGHDVVLRRLDARQGERIITRGAANLFSREFYKPPTPPGQKAGEVDDDD